MKKRIYFSMCLLILLLSLIELKAEYIVIHSKDSVQLVSKEAIIEKKLLGEDFLIHVIYKNDKDEFTLVQFDSSKVGIKLFRFVKMGKKRV